MIVALEDWPLGRTGGAVQCISSNPGNLKHGTYGLFDVLYPRAWSLAAVNVYSGWLTMSSTQIGIRSYNADSDLNLSVK